MTIMASDNNICVKVMASGRRTLKTARARRRASGRQCQRQQRRGRKAGARKRRYREEANEEKGKSMAEINVPSTKSWQHRWRESV